MTRSMTVTCYWVEDALSRYLDGELSTECAERLARHLESCADCCKRRAHEEELLVDTVAILSPGEPSPELEGRLRASLVAAAGTAGGHPWRRWLGDRLEGVAALLVVGLGLWALFSLPSNPSSPQTRIPDDAHARHEIPGDPRPEVAAMPSEPLPDTIVPAGLVQVCFRRDVDGDGQSDLADGRMMLAHIQGGEALPCQEAADLDGDDRVTPQDCVAHLHALTGYAPPLYEPPSEEEQPCGDVACL